MPLVRRRPGGNPELLPADLHPVLRRLYAARSVTSAELSLELRQLLAPAMLGMDEGVRLLAEAVRADRRIVIAGDYDADGATATTLAILGLRALGARHVDYVVPDRFRMGYGLSPALAEMASEKGAEVLVTVDNGIASLAGVERARELGMTVLVTDHHLAGPQLPSAHAIVNPNQPGCGFASKHLAGVGVMFYVLLALRTRLREGSWFTDRPEPNLADWLDLVAVGTVADVVKLDYNNRILVEQGLRRIRAGRCRAGLLAMLQCAGREPGRLSATDLGFVLGPRINAAGRLDDIRTGIECLLAPTHEQAMPSARSLEQFNRERREIETQMREDAQALVVDDARTGVSLFDPGWHEGVVGLVASRIKDQLHRPVIAFASAQEAGMLKGSGRSIRGLHLRDALAAVDARNPGMILRFGGHAMAAGLSIREERFAEFSAAFDRVCAELLDAEALEQVLETDGVLQTQELNLETARCLEHAGPWGQGFPPPMFEADFTVQQARLVGSEQSHAKYRLGNANTSFGAIDFNGATRLVSSGNVRVIYRLAVNRYLGNESLDLQIVDLQPLAVGQEGDR